MTTIDHAAEAMHSLIAARKADELSAAKLHQEAAQVHATLALVEAQREANEQARIASIIALGETLDYRNTYMGEAQMRDDIKKGLGL